MRRRFYRYAAHAIMASLTPFMLLIALGQWVESWEWPDPVVSLAERLYLKSLR